MHEAGSHPETGLYGPSVLSGELIPPADPASSIVPKENKIWVSGEDLYKPENERVLINAIWPRPSYILVTTDGQGHINVLPISSGSLQSTEPAVQVPVPKNTVAYENIKKSGQFVISIPNRDLIENFELLEKNPSNLEEAGFSLIPPNMLGIPGIKECPVTMDCKMVMFEDIPGTNYAILIGRKVGVILDKEIATNLDPKQYSLRDRLIYMNKVYASYLYAVMDRGMIRKWGFQDAKNLSVRPLPSWVSRYTGGWWGPGPSLNYWLIELCDEGLISKREYYKIRHALRLWNDGKGIPHLAEFIDNKMKTELRKKLTKLFTVSYTHLTLPTN